jgi:nitrile hydratase accessory protein
MAGRLLDLPALPRDGEGPVFSEPWQAHAFALAVRLAEAGHFSWAEWTAFLSQEIRMAQERANPDARAREPGLNYYYHWLGALERLCALKGLATSADVERRQEQWRAAYRHTPHGQPVELSAGSVHSDAAC